MELDSKAVDGGDGRIPSEEDSDDENGPNLVQLLGPAEARRILIDGVERLPERERLVLSLYYYEGLTFDEVSSVLEIPESRVGKLHSRSILRLTNGLKAGLREIPAT